MARRIIYNHEWSSNGWPMVDEGSCTWVKVPGTNPTVRIQIQNGEPLAILRAWVADINAYVERVRDDDTACWTAGNKVTTSNHLSGTAVDIDWNLHPFEVADAGWSRQQIATIRELLEFYEGTVFWANDWSNPKDAMHFQLASLANGGDINTFGNPHTRDFIVRKVRADGFSTFRRGNAPQVGDPALVLSQATGLTLNRATQILPMVQTGLLRAACNNPNRIAMWLAQIGHESAGFNATEEYQSGDETTDRWKYKGRTWIQITWRSNYAGFSKWCYALGLVPTADYFVAVPKQLAELKWAGLGAAWYWTVARPSINSLCDDRNLREVTRLINGGYNGLTDRTDRYNRALALGDQLLALTAEDDDMFTDEDRRLLKVLAKDLFPNRSMYGDPSDRDTTAGRALNAHAFGWDERVEGSAFRGESWAIELVAKAAKNPDPFLSAHALAVLNEIKDRNPQALEGYLAQKDA